MSAVAYDTAKTLEILHSVVQDKGYDYTVPTVTVWDYNGSHQEPSCVYFESDESPSCVVGHVFDRVGVTLSDLGFKNDQRIDYTLDDLRETVAFEDPAREMLTRAQRSQDGGGDTSKSAMDNDRRWGTALGLAYCQVFDLPVRPAVQS